jgi:hypothetical protein
MACFHQIARAIASAYAMLPLFEPLCVVSSLSVNSSQSNNNLLLSSSQDHMVHFSSQVTNSTNSSMDGQQQQHHHHTATGQPSSNHSLTSSTSSSMPPPTIIAKVTSIQYMLKSILFPAIKKYLQCQRYFSDTTKMVHISDKVFNVITTLEDLYKVFERC